MVTRGDMTLRIWEQGLAAAYSLPGYARMIVDHYRAFQSRGTEVVVHGVKDDAGELARQVSGQAVKYVALHRRYALQIAANAQRAEAEGFDAFIIGALQDTGLLEARTLVDIPVLGYGEVSMHTACLFGERFGFVAINPEMEQLLQTQVRECGLEARSAPTTYMDCGYDDLRDAVDGRTARFLEAFHVAARQAVHRHDVDVLLPGQTIIAELLWREGIKEIEKAVVLDPRLALLKTAEMLIEFRRAGTGISRRGFYWAKPPAQLVADVESYIRQ